MPPESLIAATDSSSFSGFRATQATFAPHPASAVAMARPRPREAPVTMATCPERSTEIVPLFVVITVKAFLSDILFRESAASGDYEISVDYGAVTFGPATAYLESMTRLGNVQTGAVAQIDFILEEGSGAFGGD